MVFKEFLYIDFVEMGEVCVVLVLCVFKGEILLVVFVYDVCMIDILLISQVFMCGFVDCMKVMEVDGIVLFVLVIYGFMVGDLLDFGVKIVVVIDNDCCKGDVIVKCFGEELFFFCGQMKLKFLMVVDVLV